jgi:hypothetical protein
MQFRASGLTWHVTHVSDGSLDTLIEVQPIALKRDGQRRYKAQTVRFSQDYASQMYSSKGRVFSNRLKQLAKEAIEAYDADMLPGDDHAA